MAAEEQDQRDFMRAKRVGHRKQNYPTFFSIIPTFKKKFPHFHGHSHIFLKNLAGHPDFRVKYPSLYV